MNFSWYSRLPVKLRQDQGSSCMLHHVIILFALANLLSFQKPRTRKLRETQLFAHPALPVPSPDTVLPDVTQHLWLEQIPAPRYLGLCSVCRIEVSGSARVGGLTTWSLAWTAIFVFPVNLSALQGFVYCNDTPWSASSNLTVVVAVLSCCWNFASSSRVCLDPVWSG